MKIFNQEPAIYKECQRVFGVGEWRAGLVIAYDNAIYCYNDLSERPDIIAHEQVHLAQQNLIGVEKWWEQYLADPAFRLREEVAAYRAQVSFVRMNYERNRAVRLIQCFCKDMVDLYGGMITSKEAAYKLIV